MSVRIAVDIGGTFTDVALDAGDVRTTIKLLTTSAAPEVAVLDGIEAALAETGTEPGAVDLVIQGTTLATNAIIERKGAKTALITTDGFRDVIEVGYETRYDQYDLMLEKPVPLVPRELRFGVEERVDLRGRVLTPLNEATVDALIPKLERAGVESVAIGLLHAYANPEHERRIEMSLTEALPDLSITLSSEVCPEIREYERFTTATANAYVRPLMARYLGRLAEQLEDRGLSCPLLMMTSGGGLTSLEAAMRHPIRLVESGPAGGAILVSRMAAAFGLDHVISFDMGGTTAKICLIEKHEPQSAREFEIERAARFTKGSGLPLRIPVIEMVEIGAGGGSIARLDAMRRIAVGPASAGADPGPAAYGRGGTEPTVTDADIVLGRIDPERFAGGKVTLEPDRAAAAVESEIARPLEIDGTMAAFGIAEMVDEAMANAARVHAVERGKVASRHTLIAFGGAAPLHAARVAEKLGIGRIIVPTDAGVGSAIGFLQAPVAFELVQSRHLRVKDFDAETINALFDAMRTDALAVVRAGAPKAPLTEHKVAYMRYFGQGHEIVVTLPERPFRAGDEKVVREAFDEGYRQLYRRTIPNAEVEVLSWGLTVSTEAEQPAPPGEVAAQPAPAPAGERRVFDAAHAGWVTVPVHWRADLPPGTRIAGPVVIAEEQTATYVTEQFDAAIAGNGHIVLEQKQGTKS